MGAAADGAGGAVRQPFGQQARLRVEKGRSRWSRRRGRAPLRRRREDNAPAPAVACPRRCPSARLWASCARAVPRRASCSARASRLVLGLRAPKGGEALLQSGQFSVPAAEGGAALFSSGVLEGGGVPGGRSFFSRLSSPSKAARLDSPARAFRPARQRGGIPAWRAASASAASERAAERPAGPARRSARGGASRPVRPRPSVCWSLSSSASASVRAAVAALSACSCPASRASRRAALLPATPARPPRRGQLVQNGFVGVPFGPAQAGEQLPDADALLLPLAGEGGVLACSRSWRRW